MLFGEFGMDDMGMLDMTALGDVADVAGGQGWPGGMPGWGMPGWGGQWWGGNPWWGGHPWWGRPWWGRPWRRPWHRPGWWR